MLIPREVFKISGAASSDVSRYQLNGVHFRRDSAGAPLAEATTGKILVQTTWREDPLEDFPAVATEGMNVAPKPDFTGAILPIDACIAAGKMVDRKMSKIRPILRNVAMDEHSANGKVQLSATNLDNTSRIAPSTIEGTYPNVSSAVKVPSHVKARIKFNLSILADVIKVLIDMHGRDTEADIYIEDADKPVFILPKKDGDGKVLELTTIAMAMPMVNR